MIEVMLEIFFIAMVKRIRGDHVCNDVREVVRGEGWSVTVRSRLAGVSLSRVAGPKCGLRDLVGKCGLRGSGRSGEVSDPGSRWEVRGSGTRDPEAARSRFWDPEAARSEASGGERNGRARDVDRGRGGVVP